jgi:hypothetical protein
MENGHGIKEPMLCLTMCAYRREGMSEDDYRNYMTTIHAPLVQGLMIKHGIDKYSMVSTMVPSVNANRKQARNHGLLIYGLIP